MLGGKTRHGGCSVRGSKLAAGLHFFHKSFPMATKMKKREGGVGEGLSVRDRLVRGP